MTCETCGATGHSGTSCPLTQEDANFIGTNNNNPNSGLRPQQGWNSKPNHPFRNQQGRNFNNNFQPSLKDLVYNQKQINDNISKKFLANDKILESLASQLEGFSSVIKNQLSFNKMIETQVAQLASSCPNANMGKLPGQPEVPSKENVNAVTTRGGKSTREPPFDRMQEPSGKPHPPAMPMLKKKSRRRLSTPTPLQPRKTPQNPLELHGITTIQLPYRFRNG